MKIGIAWSSKSRSGGGFSFASIFTQQAQIEGHDVVPWQDSDIVLIPSASVISKEEFQIYKEAGKKIVLRIDNALKNSRNRGAGMSRMKEMADGADEVVYQSKWACNFLEPFLGRKGTVIYNGIDTDIFNPNGEKFQANGEPVFVWSCASKGETKRWEWAWYRYQELQRQYPQAVLLITGIIPGEISSYRMDFFNNERFKYFGFVESREKLAEIFRASRYFLATYENDCYSQTYCEALCCGCELFEPSMTGGTPELLENWKTGGIEFFSASRMTQDYLKLFETLL